MGIGDVAKKLGEMWNNLSDSEKQPFLSKANKLKDKYQKVRLSSLFIREPKQLDDSHETNFSQTVLRFWSTCLWNAGKMTDQCVF